MEPKESIEIRRAMAEMHDSILKRMDLAYKNNQYIEVCWLCYACFESRVNRVLSKICEGCTKEKRTNTRPVGITTKLECYVRLIKCKYPPLLGEDYNLLNTVKGWCKERNDLIHGMASLEYYNDADKRFQSLSTRGINLVKRMYNFGADVRNYYYQTTEIPAFDDSVITKCRLSTKCIKE